ncbi:NmrA family NAD(P)-binding protein [Terrabacter sp. NPDC080008]|uniref:SDR family oxidoreductase n=1 Tax=Terrabacter sp. NPDC080008 TaxID=3155176 RepID=UPI00344B4DF4
MGTSAPAGAAAPTVLVIGAAGKTGRAVTAALARRGVAVRAAVRSPARAETAYAAGAASISVCDLESGAGLDEALTDATAVYHLAPNVHPDEVAIARRVVAAAARAGVQRFAFHSVLHPHDGSMPHHVRKGLAEEVVRSAFPRATVLRPAAYHQNLVAAARSGRIAVPHSLDTPFTNVDLDDVAEVAAEVLTEAGHEARTYELAGPEVLTVREQAVTAARVLGHPVTAEQLTLEAWAAGPGSSLPEQARADLLAMFTAYDREGLVGDPTTLTTLLGRRPTTWGQALVAESATT